MVEMKKQSSNATYPEPIANFQDILGNTVDRKNVVVRSLKRSARRVTLCATRFENIMRIVSIYLLSTLIIMSAKIVMAIIL